MHDAGRMKNCLVYRMTALVSVSVVLVSCGGMNRAMDGGYNPLDSPGGASAGQQDPYGPMFAPGSFLQTVSSSTAFFVRFPNTEDQPNKILSDYTDVKVISTRGAYVKVEVVNTGEVGYVPSIMLGEKRSSNRLSVTPGAGEILGTPDILPEPQVPSVTPEVTPEHEIPGIYSPGITDPSKPAE